MQIRGLPKAKSINRFPNKEQHYSTNNKSNKKLSYFQIVVVMKFTAMSMHPIVKNFYVKG